VSQAASDERILLLARKYQGISTAEDDALLRILTQRLRHISPRVTPEDLNRLLEINRLWTMVREVQEL
jgi:hypothetical protein